MEAFASYAFNKSHAAAYSLLTYQTAYLKTYYLPEFITATLNDRITNIEKLTHYIAYAKQEKIEVLPPDINLSDVYFSTDGKAIRFGLSALKNVGVGVMEEIIKEREENGPYKDFNDYIWRASPQALNKRCIESLIKTGAFDCFGKTRSQLMAVFSIMVDRCLERKKQAMDGQMNLFGDIIEDTKLLEDNEFPNINEFTNTIKLQYEKEISGTYLSGHPLDTYLDVIKNFTFNSSFLPSETTEDEDDVGLSFENDSSFESLLNEKEEPYKGLKSGDIVTCGGVIANIKAIQTKSGGRMAFLTIEDLTGSFEVVVFPKVFDKFKDLLLNDSLVAIRGRFTLRDGERPSISADNIELLDNQENEDEDSLEQNNTSLEEVEIVKPKKLWLKYNINDGIIHDAVKKILSDYNGIDEVYVKDAISNQAFKMNTLVSVRESLIYELETIIEKENIFIQG